MQRGYQKWDWETEEGEEEKEGKGKGGPGEEEEVCIWSQLSSLDFLVIETINSFLSL